jgi:hypothetical protein
MVSREVIMLLKIKPSYHLRALSHEFSGITIMLVVLYFLKFNPDALMIFGIWFALLTLPVIYLHIEYYLANRGQEIIIENDELRVITKNGNTYKFKFAELSKVILYKSASLDKGGIPLTPIESYHYARIITKSEKQIIVTCLMYPKLEEVVSELKGVQGIRKKRLFCTVAWK